MDDEIIIIWRKIDIFLILYINKIIGAIFCHVNIIKIFIQDNPSIISGNQKWNGAAPILIRNEVFIINIIKFFNSSVNKFFKFRERRIEIRRIEEAIDCVIKYFIVASAGNLFFVLFKIGIIERRFISIPIHIVIHE